MLPHEPRTIFAFLITVSRFSSPGPRTSEIRHRIPRAPLGRGNKKLLSSRYLRAICLAFDVAELKLQPPKSRRDLRARRGNERTSERKRRRTTGRRGIKRRGCALPVISPAFQWISLRNLNNCQMPRGALPPDRSAATSVAPSSPPSPLLPSGSILLSSPPSSSLDVFSSLSPFRPRYFKINLSFALARARDGASLFPSIWLVNVV